MIGLSVIDKTSVANITAGFAVISGIVISVIAPEGVNNQLIQAITMTALGYLFGAATPAIRAKLNGSGSSG